MQLREKKTYSVKDCVNKLNSAVGQDKGRSEAHSGAPCLPLASGLL